MDTRGLIIIIIIGVVGMVGFAGVFLLGHPFENDDGVSFEDDGSPHEPEQSTNSSEVSPSQQQSNLSTDLPFDIEGDDRPGKLAASHNEFSRFQDVAQEVGLSYETNRFSGFVHDLGSYVVDFNNNGYEDLLLLGGEKPALFENTDGRYELYRTFDQPSAVTAHFFDYNNNGFRDLLIASAGESPVLYENRQGTFVEQAAGFDRTVNIPSGITTADFTGNGCLDVYIADIGSGKQALEIEDSLEVAAEHPRVRPETDKGPSNVLFAGDCNSFHDITEEANVGGSSFTMAVSAADLTGDGNIDIHAANDFTADYIYQNKGDGTFEQVDMGPASDRNAMSSVAMDMTGNHRLDLFVTNVYFEESDPATLVPVTKVALPKGNNLFHNDGDTMFTDIATDHGLEKGSWGWAATVADYTNDGHLDIIHAASYLDLPVVENHADIYRPPQVWKGTANSWEKINGFELGFQQHNARGVTRVDYQNDGTLDFVVVDTGNAILGGVEPGTSRTFLYENQLESNDSLQLWIRNPGGIERNAGVYVETDERIIYRETNARSDLLSQDSRLIHVGTKNENVKRVVVKWPDGTSNSYDSLTTGNRYILTPETQELVD